MTTYTLALFLTFFVVPLLTFVLIRAVIKESKNDKKKLYLKDRLERLDAFFKDVDTAITLKAYEACKVLIKHYISDYSFDYRIYPTLDKGICIEFDNKGWDYSIEIDSDASVEIYGVKIDDREDLDPLKFDSIYDDDFVKFLKTRLKEI